MKTNKFDINDLVALGEYEGRITEMQLSEGDMLYYINLDHGQGGWYDEKELVLLENCPLENPFKTTTEAIWQRFLDQKSIYDDCYRDTMVYGTGIYTFSEDGPHVIKAKDWNVGPTECTHSWVDIGFMQSKIVCKHCNREQN